jgi:hypothetical protein
VAYAVALPALLLGLLVLVLVQWPGRRRGRGLTT